MNISKIAFEKIKEFEGCKLQAYQDAAGVWTIGYGHTYNVRQGDRISQWYADDMLREDLENVERQLTELHDPEVRHQALAVFYAPSAYHVRQAEGGDTEGVDALGVCRRQAPAWPRQAPPVGV